MNVQKFAHVYSPGSLLFLPNSGAEFKHIMNGGLSGRFGETIMQVQQVVI